jgi:tRNA 2-selenouridine synthase
LQLPITWKPLLYCWRGGKRSGSLALILDQIGFKVSLIEGGYKDFRAELVKNIAELALKIQFKVVCGLTGSGKTRLLHELARQGHQVLDLEALANHRSSVLGLMPGDHQPSQKAFDTAIWNVLRHLDLSRPVFVESESKKVGNVAIPEALIQAIRQSPCVILELGLEHRIELLMQDYAHFSQDSNSFITRLNTLTQSLGKKQIESWTELVQQAQTPKVVQELLQLHYDPIYVSSSQRNFLQYKNAITYSLGGLEASELERVASEVALAN